MASKSKAEVALREAQQLLAEVRFTPQEPVLLDGGLVTVSAAANPAAEPGYLDVLISVYMPGHVYVEWENLALFVEGEDVWLVFLNAEGKARIRIPEADAIRGLKVVASPCAGEVRPVGKKGVLQKQKYDSAPVELVVTSEVSEFRESFDGVIAEGKIDPANYVAVEFVTDDPRIAEGRVRIQFVSADTRADTFLTEEAPPFEPAGQVWKTSYEKQIHLPATAVMRFAVRPAEKKKEG